MNVGAMLAIHWRTHWRRVVVWVVGVVGSLAGTAVAVVGLYDTPQQIQSYADAIAGGALYAINGRVEGIDSLGGIVQDEFGFMASFLLPLFGISLVGQLTRREEEAGRLELLLAGRLGRVTPVASALVLTSAAIAALIVGAFVAVAAVGIPWRGALLYACSLGLLAAVFAGVAALAAQVVLHGRGVHAVGLALLLAAYVIRGIGDVTGTWVTWLSPLGWQEKTAPFGPQRWWVLLVPAVAAIGLGAAAILVADRRDLGSSLLRTAGGPGRASSWLRHPIGLAARIHRSSLIGWWFGAIVLAVTMGALAQQVIDAIVGNPALGDAIGAGAERPQDGFTATVVLYLAIVAGGYVVQSVGALRHEETEGRLEPRLVGTLGRTRWLAAHGLVLLAGLVVVTISGSVTFALATSVSTGDRGEIARLVWAGLAYLPAELAIGAGALALFGAWPRGYGVAWIAYAAIAFIAFLGPGLQLDQWVLDLSPTTHAGNPPLGDADPRSLAVTTAVAVVLTVVAFAGFRRRAVPQ